LNDEQLKQTFRLMGKKRFDKAASQKFHLLHRSVADKAYATTNHPTDLVLVAAEEVSS
jgi:hypothetical protein